MRIQQIIQNLFIGLILPCLLLSSCALIGLEEEEETTSTASSTLSTPSSSGSITIGSYSYSSSLRTTNCRSVTDGTITLYINTILSFDTSALTAKHTDNIYSNSTCTTSAGSTVTFGGSSFSNPIIEDYTDIQVNKMSFGTGAQMQGADGNMVANDSNLYGVVGKFNSTTDSTSSKSNGDLRVIVWVIPGSNTTAQMSSGSSCADSTQSVPSALGSCTHYWNTTGQIYSAQTN